MKRGFTLIEVMVAIFIFVLVILAAYQIYERSQKTYILGEQMADLQQNLRFAYEEVSHDLRIAGYNVYPDSESTRPDEQIEGMWNGAIAIRADFNEEIAPSGYACVDSNGDKLCDSGTGEFLTVSTDNSEIRIYALAKKPFDPNGETIRFRADLSKPRDAKVNEVNKLEIIEIKGVALTQNNPPYTLYRITIDEDEVIPSGQKVPESALIWTPIASNIYSLNFTYYSESGISETHKLAYDEPDISGKEMDLLRKHGFPFGTPPMNFVKNVYFTLKGMTQRPDPKFVDPKDPNEDTKNHRKIEFSSTIVMKNLGMSPHELADTVPPDAPKNLEVVGGYCDGALYTWEPSLALDVTAYYIQVASQNLYEVNWGGSWKYNCDDYPQTCTITSTPEIHPGGRFGWYLRGLEIGTKYYARVFSQDRAGNLSLDSTNTVEITIDPNPIKPNPPQVGDITEGVEDNLNRLFVGYTPPTGYDLSQNNACKEPPASKDGYFSLLVRDLYGYKLFHRRQISQEAQEFTPQINADLVEDPAKPFTTSVVSYPDIKACPCEYYAYKIQAVTTCPDSEDDYTKSPPCLHISEFSEISKGEDGNPKAYLAPELQPIATVPQIVPAKPGTPNAIAIESPPGSGHYNITLSFSTNFSVVYSDMGAPPSYTPAPNNLKIECWRYKIFVYDEDPLENPSAPGTEIVDEVISGVGDGPDWDAMVDGGKVFLVEGEPVSFNFPLDIPHGEKKYIRVQGIYNCSTGIREGEPSLPAPVPCDILWQGVIFDPPVDYSVIRQPSHTFVFKVTGLPPGESISLVQFTIYPLGISSGPLACIGNPECSTLWIWNNLGVPDGTYQLKVTAIDQKGCQAEFLRYFTINSSCGIFTIENRYISSDKLIFNLRESITDPNVKGVLLKRVSFYTPGTYLYEDINFYNQQPDMGSPPPTPVLLWSSAFPQDINNKWIGKDGDWPYLESNFPECPIILNLDIDPTNAYSNWFKINFDKEIISSNGALNLMGSFHYKIGGATETFTFSGFAKGTSFSVSVPGVVLNYNYVASKKMPNISVDYCIGSFNLSCNLPPNCDGTLTVNYIPFANTDLVCTNIPIFSGP